MQGSVVRADNTMTNRGGEVKGELPKEVRISKNEFERMDIILPDKQHGLAKEEGCGKKRRHSMQNRSHRPAGRHQTAQGIRETAISATQIDTYC